jgi:hypothetical protein
LTGIKMSEEKPNFKITDRRLFNADGSPREVEREEPAPAPAPAQEADAAPAPSVTEAADFQPALGEEEPARAPGGEGAAAPESRDAAGGPAPEDEAPDFLMAVEFIASFAADALGMVNHPGGEPRDINPPLAKQCIDMLGALQRKTRGNLNEEEQHFLEVILSQLRMQYVSVTGAGRVASPRGGGRGFTGGDITGGM